ncbi:MAG: T9SS type A sorting domain-containing protein [Flavobacteriales bacterium]
MLSVQCHTQAFDWAVGTSPASSAFVYDVEVDADDNVYAVGHFNSSVTIGSFTLSGGGDDVFLAKIDSTDNVVWAVSGGSSSADYAADVDVDLDGNIYITGTIYGAATFGTHTTAAAGVQKLFVAKYDNDGNCLWVTSTVSTGTVGNGLAVSNNGTRVYTAGAFYATSIFPNRVLSDGDTSPLMACMDSTGAWIWGNQTGDYLVVDQANAVDCDEYGNAYFTGSVGAIGGAAVTFTSELPLIAVNVISVAGLADAFVCTYNPIGQLLGAAVYGTSGWNEGKDIEVVSSTEYYVTGDYQYPITINATTLTNAGNYDAFLARMGSTMWAVKCDGTRAQKADALSYHDSNIYWSVQAEDTTHFGAQAFIPYSYPGYIGIDACVAKMTDAGTYLWALQAGGRSYDGPGGVAAGTADDVYLGGYINFGSPTADNAHFGSQTISSTYTAVGFVTRIDEHGIDLTVGDVATENCTGNIMNVPYTAYGVFNPGNIFTVQLSDATGSFAAPVAIGSIAATSSATIAASIPLSTPEGYAYRVRVVSTSPVLTTTMNENVLYMRATSQAPTSISASSYSVCPSTLVSLTAVGGVAGTYGDYYWYSGGCGSTYIGTGISTAVMPATTTTYFVRTGGYCNTSMCASVTIVVASCGGAVNDAFAGAKNVSLSGVAYPVGNCFSENLMGATVSVESYTPNVLPAGGQDLWYKITSPSTGLRIAVTSASMNVVVEMHLSSTAIWDTENAVFGAGTEVMNIGGLTEGETYFIAVRSFDGILGPFTICVQALMDSRCNDGSGTYSLCSNFKPKWTGANMYSFHFVPTGSTPGAPTTATATGQIPLSNATLALQYGGTYNALVDANYNLINGAGSPETIVIAGSDICAVSIAPHADVQVKSTQRCPASLPKSSLLSAKPYVCGPVLNFEYEFTEINCITSASVGLPFSKFTSSASPNLSLGFTLPSLVAGACYSVRIRPVFTYGNGEWGTPQCIQISSSLFTESFMPGADTESEKTIADEWNATLYPNPNSGETVHIMSSELKMKQVTVRISDSMGRLIFSRIYIVDGTLNTSIQFANRLSAGIYLVDFVCGDEVKTQKLMVN